MNELDENANAMWEDGKAWGYAVGLVVGAVFGAAIMVLAVIAGMAA